MNTDKIDMPDEKLQTNRTLSVPWQSKVLKLLGWFLLLFGLAGAGASIYFMKFIIFSPEIIIDPFGAIVFLMCLFPVLVGFPLLITLSHITKELQRIRQRIELNESSKN